MSTDVTDPRVAVSGEAPDAHTASNEWDDEDSQAEARLHTARGGADEEEAAAAIVPIEANVAAAQAAAPSSGGVNAPPPARQSSVITDDDAHEDDDDSSDDDDDSSDDGELLLLPPAVAALRASPNAQLTSASPAHNATPIAAAAAATSACILDDALANPPPPPARMSPTLRPPSSSSGTNVISIPKRPAAAAGGGGGGGVKLERSETAHTDATEGTGVTSMETGEDEEEDGGDDDHNIDDDSDDDDDGPKYSPLPDDDAASTGAGSTTASVAPAAVDVAAGASAPAVKVEGDTLTFGSSSAPTKFKLKLSGITSSSSSTTAIKTETGPKITVKLENHTSSVATAAAAAANADAARPFVPLVAAAPVPPALQIPPTTGLTPHGQATLARYRSYFFDRHWQPMDVQVLSGKEVTEKWMRACGLRKPFISTSASELGIKAPTVGPEGPVPAVRALCDALHPDHELSVIDVATQTESGLWRLADWSAYFATPAPQRTAVCNVISLEISTSDYAKENLRAPKYVRDIDWIKAWPKEVQVAPSASTVDQAAASSLSLAATTNSGGGAPQRGGAGASSSAHATSAAGASGVVETVPIAPPVPVQLYCLMGAAGSFTDFHADFGGSSVWYHVVSGRKMFLLVEPTKDNMEVYENWVRKGKKQLTTFLPDLYAARDRAREKAEGLALGSIPCCVRLLSVESSQTLFVPGGWIHAVYTPLDSLVFGGNFLHSFHIGAQLMVYNQELNTGVPPRFQYPKFEALHWLMAREFVFKLREPLAQLRVTLFELHGLATLVRTAAAWMAQSAAGVRQGYDASRPRRGSRMAPGEEPPPSALDPAQPRSRAPQDWAHNLPCSWADSLALLRELDCLVHYNMYLLEREDYEDRMEQRREAGAAAAVGGDDQSTEELSAEGWARREALAQKCFQMLPSFRSNNYPLVPMTNVNALPFLRKTIKRKGVRGAARAAATTGAAQPVFRAPKEDEPMSTEPKEELAPSASGRVRHHVSRYGQFISEEDLFGHDDDEDDEVTRARKAAAAAAAAEAGHADGADEEELKESDIAMADAGDESKSGEGGTAAAGGAGAAAAAASKKRRRSPTRLGSVVGDDERDPDAEVAGGGGGGGGADSSDYESSDSDSSADDGGARGSSSSSDGDFVVDDGATGKSRKRKGKKARKGDIKAGAEAVAPMPAAGAPLKLSDLQARARAAAAAASAGSMQKVIPAGAKVAAKRAPKAAGAAAAGPPKPKQASSAKARIMQRLGLSGKLR